MRHIRILLASAGVLLSVPPLSAQVLVRGNVAAAGADSLPFSIVSLEPGFPQRLTDARGHFEFRDVVPGTYRLLVRQIAHLPFDTILVIGRDPPPPLVIALRRLAIELPPVTARATMECRVPGPPDPRISAEGAAVFEQAVENGRRYRLLAHSFPHRWVLERTVLEVREGRQRVTKIDTIGRQSRSEWRYAPGRLVADGSGEVMIRMWSLMDLADSGFIANHCFRLAGRDTLGGETFIRMDFQPPLSFTQLDVEGSAYLDSATFVVRHTLVRLTQPRQRLSNVDELVAHSQFRQVAPWIFVDDQLSAITRLRWPRGAERIEQLRLLDVQFVRPLDAGADP